MQNEVNSPQHKVQIQRQAIYMISEMFNCSRTLPATEESSDLYYSYLKKDQLLRLVPAQVGTLIHAVRQKIFDAEENARELTLYGHIKNMQGEKFQYEDGNMGAANAAYAEAPSNRLAKYHLCRNDLDYTKLQIYSPFFT